MTEIRFYHLQKQSLDQALPLILEKALEKGHRILVKCANDDQMNELDKALWSYKNTSFLAHGTQTDDLPDQQPIILNCNDDNPNDADLLVLTGGTQSGDLDDFKLCCDMFDGNVDEELSAARSRWKQLSDTDHDITYWQQTDTGGWNKKA